MEAPKSVTWVRNGLLLNGLAEAPQGVDHHLV